MTRPAYALQNHPDCTVPAIVQHFRGFEDTSWSNDAGGFLVVWAGSPSDGRFVHVFADRPDPADREMAGPRFSCGPVWIDEPSDTDDIAGRSLAAGALGHERQRMDRSGFTYGWPSTFQTDDPAALVEFLTSIGCVTGRHTEQELNDRLFVGGSSDEQRAAAEAVAEAATRQVGVEFSARPAGDCWRVDLTAWPAGLAFGEWFEEIMERHGFLIHD